MSLNRESIASRDDGLERGLRVEATLRQDLVAPEQDRHTLVIAVPQRGILIDFAMLHGDSTGQREL